MKKQTLNEISRIQELMGVNVKKPLINEQANAVLKKIWALADDFLTTVPKKAGALADEIQIGSVTVSRKFWQDIETVLANPELISTLNKSELKALGKILSQSPELVDKTYREVIQAALKNAEATGLTERELFELITKKVRGNPPDVEPMDFDEVILEMTGGNELAAAMLTKKFTIRQMEFESGNFKIEVNPAPKVVTKKVLTPDEIKNFNKVIDAKSVKTFFTDFVQLWKKDLETIKEEIVELSNGFISELEGKSIEEIEELTKAYSVAISRKLDLAEIKMNGAAADVLDNYGVNPQIINKIKTGEEPFLKVFRDARAADSQSLRQVMWDTTKEFFIEVKDLTKGIFRREGNTILRAFNPKTSVGQWFYTNQWASLNKLYRLAIKMSPGESKDKLITYIAATMFASSVGFVMGEFIKSTLSGLWKVYGYGAWNAILDGADKYFGGGDGEIFGRSISDWKAEIPGDVYDWDDFLGVVGVPLDAITQEIHSDVLEGFEDNGIKDVLLRLMPGGVLTYPESMFSQFLEGITPGDKKVPNLRDAILGLFGLDPEEVDETLKDFEETQPELTLDINEVLKVAPENLKPWIWQDDDGKIWLMQDETTDYPITIENNEYVVKPDPNSPGIRLQK